MRVIVIAEIAAAALNRNICRAMAPKNDGCDLLGRDAAGGSDGRICLECRRYADLGIDCECQGGKQKQQRRAPKQTKKYMTENPPFFVSLPESIQSGRSFLLFADQEILLIFPPLHSIWKIRVTNTFLATA